LSIAAFFIHRENNHNQNETTNHRFNVLHHGVIEINTRLYEHFNILVRKKREDIGRKYRL
jgi:hypothetical protein